MHAIHNNIRLMHKSGYTPFKCHFVLRRTLLAISKNCFGLELFVSMFFSSCLQVSYQNFRWNGQCTLASRSIFFLLGWSENNVGFLMRFALRARSLRKRNRLSWTCTFKIEQDMGYNMCKNESERIWKKAAINWERKASYYCAPR